MTETKPVTDEQRKEPQYKIRCGHCGQPFLADNMLHIELCRSPDTNYVHPPQFPMNGTELECDGEELRPDGTCAKCERVNERVTASITSLPPLPSQYNHQMTEVGSALTSPRKP